MIDNYNEIFFISVTIQVHKHTTYTKTYKLITLAFPFNLTGNAPL
jgi:hypothetical protein